MLSMTHYGRIFHTFLKLEPLILLATTFAFWYASPIRDNWVWLILLLTPILGARLIVFHRLWTDNPLNEFLIGFIALCVLNIFTAPYETRGIILIFRPLLGIALFVYLVEYARTHGNLSFPLIITFITSILLAIVALTATEWSEGKTAFSFITDHLPSYLFYPGVEGLFNPNELAGAITWLAPLVAGLTIFYWRKGQRLRIVLGMLSTTLLLMALLFGQSLSGMLGIIAGLLIVLTPRRYWHVVTGAIVIVFVIAQTIILVSPSTALNLAGSLSGRSNLNSLQHRQVIWTSAKQAVIDHPLTGIGMAMYRNPAVWDIYPTPGYDRYKAPHAHNEILQIATDLGIPGALLFISWYAAALYMLYYGWKHGDMNAKHLVAAISAGLIAHLIYSLTDAIPLWDRFAFIFYWLLGLAAAQYVMIRYTQPEESRYSQSEARA